MIYLIEAVGSGCAKIGYCKSVKAIGHRLSNLQVGSPYPLKIIATIKGTRTDEKNLHKQFADRWKRGEWFHLTPEIEDFFGIVDEPPFPAFLEDENLQRQIDAAYAMSFGYAHANRQERAA